MYINQFFSKYSYSNLYNYFPNFKLVYNKRLIAQTDYSYIIKVVVIVVVEKKLQVAMH